METRSLIQDQLANSHQLLKVAIQEISDDEAHRIPSGTTLAPVVWQVGHVALSNAGFLKRAGVPTSVPEGYAELFKQGSGGAAAYPPMDEVVRVLDDTHSAVVAAAAEAELDAPDEGPRGIWKTRGGMYAFISVHRWYHIGKIATLRALLGKPRLFG